MLGRLVVPLDHIVAVSVPPGARQLVEGAPLLLGANLLPGASGRPLGQLRAPVVPEAHVLGPLSGAGGQLLQIGAGLAGRNGPQLRGTDIILVIIIIIITTIIASVVGLVALLVLGARRPLLLLLLLLLLMVVLMVVVLADGASQLGQDGPMTLGGGAGLRLRVVGAASGQKVGNVEAGGEQPRGTVRPATLALVSVQLHFRVALPVGLGAGLLLILLLLLQLVLLLVVSLLLAALGPFASPRAPRLIAATLLSHFGLPANAGGQVLFLDVGPRVIVQGWHCFGTPNVVQCLRNRHGPTLNAHHCPWLALRQPKAVPAGPHGALAKHCLWLNNNCLLSKLSPPNLKFFFLSFYLLLFYVFPTIFQSLPLAVKRNTLFSLSYSLIPDCLTCYSSQLFSTCSHRLGLTSPIGGKL